VVVVNVLWTALLNPVLDLTCFRFYPQFLDDLMLCDKTALDLLSVRAIPSFLPAVEASIVVVVMSRGRVAGGPF
jgi:hypothetical protein